jgi:hypothetical protein
MKKLMGAVQDVVPRKKRLAPLIEMRRASPTAAMPSMPADEALSFLKETRGALTWTESDMVDCLNITQPTARHVIAILELQGYAKRATAGEGWLTTLNGETVSGSVSPRFRLDRVIGGLVALEARIKAANLDEQTTFRVADAVAFGDFLSGRPRVQAADVGIRLIPRVPKSGAGSSAHPEREFLKQLRAKNALVQLLPYKPWMSSRTHRRLV